MGSSGAIIGDSLFVIGEHWKKEIPIFQLSRLSPFGFTIAGDGTWSKRVIKGKIPQGRNSFACAGSSLFLSLGTEVGNVIFVFGGSTISNVSLNDLHVLDTGR